MLLSSVSFVKNCQFSDYIIGKIKEDQDKRDRKELKKLAKKGSKKTKDYNFNKIAVEDFQVCDRVTSETEQPGSVLEINSIPSEERTPESAKSTLVTIDTCDGYTFAADAVEGRLFLTEQPKQEENCYFRKQILDEESDDSDCLRQRLVAFQLESDPSCYMAATGQRRLVLKDFGDTLFDVDNPDERCFLLHESSTGVASLQPFGQRGCYVHHFDDMLSVQKLEVNWRPPEEYLYRIESIPEIEIPNNSTPVSCDITQNDSEQKSQTESIDDLKHMSETVDSKQMSETVDSKQMSETVKVFNGQCLKESKDKLKSGLIKACFGWPKKKASKKCKVNR